jgi:hypothetical protein
MTQAGIYTRRPYAAEFQRIKEVNQCQLLRWYFTALDEAKVKQTGPLHAMKPYGGKEI